MTDPDIRPIPLESPNSYQIHDISRFSRHATTLTQKWCSFWMTDPRKRSWRNFFASSTGEPTVGDRVRRVQRVVGVKSSSRTTRLDFIASLRERKAHQWDVPAYSRPTVSGPRRLTPQRRHRGPGTDNNQPGAGQRGRPGYDRQHPTTSGRRRRRRRRRRDDITLWQVLPDHVTKLVGCPDDRLHGALARLRRRHAGRRRRGWSARLRVWARRTMGVRIRRRGRQIKIRTLFRLQDHRGVDVGGSGVGQRSLSATGSVCTVAGRCRTKVLLSGRGWLRRPGWLGRWRG